MEIKVAKYAGFCFGVKRAVDGVFSLVEEKKGTPVYILGELIHNPIVNQRLAEKGVVFLKEEFLNDDLQNAEKNSVFVIRTHGVSPNVLGELRTFAKKNPEASILDMTCPFVKKIYRILEENSSDDTFTILIGDKEHPEVVGIMGYIRGKYRIFPDFDALKTAFQSNFAQEIGAKSIISVSQTTHNLEDYTR